MAITSTTNLGNGIDRHATGSHFDDASSPAAFAVNLGFTPQYIRVENVTDRIGYEWFHGADSGVTLKTVAAGTRTLDTASDDNAIQISDTTFTVPAALVVQNKQYRWIAR